MSDPKKKAKKPEYPGQSPADLTGRQQRKRLMKRLGEYKIGKEIKGYEEYVQKMTALDVLMEKYSVKNALGVAPTMDAKAKEAMGKAMEETAAAGEEYLKNAQAAKNAGELDSLKNGVPMIVDRLQGMVRRDRECLEQYDPAYPLSLPQVLETGRSTVIHLEKVDVEEHGGAQNSRIPITFRGRDGKQRKGFFTRETKEENSLDEYVNELLDKAAEKCSTQAGKEQVRGLLKTYRDQDPERRNGLSDAQLFRMLSEDFTQKEELGGGQHRIRLKAGVLEKKLGLSRNTVGLYGFEALGKIFIDYDKRMNEKVNRNLSEAEQEKQQKRIMGEYFNDLLGTEKGARIDNRNSAMSAVAQLLGKPKLIAGAENMRFVDDKGKTVEGTFMDYADGVDLADGGDKMKLVNANPFTGENSYKGLKQMADLQVLDYICGNVDRHQGNMMYITDERGDIVGVQGIDNDTSFGRFVNTDKNVHALPSPADMNVISADMSKKVLGLTPEMLKFTLRGRGLSEDELDFAAKRLTTLQTAIREGEAHYKTHPTDKAFEQGHLRTVENKDFQKLKITQLCGTNLFGLAYSMQRSVNEHKAYKKYAFDPQARNKQAGMQQVQAAARGFTGGYLRAALAGAGKLAEDKEKKFKIDDLTTVLRGSSPEFDKMAAAAKKAAEMERELRATPIAPTTYNQRRREIDEAVEELGRTSDAYLEKKMRERKAKSLEELRGKNDYEQARIDHAKRIREFARAYEKPVPLRGEDVTAMTKQDLEEGRIASELGEMQDKQQAMKLVAELYAKQQKPGTPDLETLLQQQKEDREKQSVEVQSKVDPKLIFKPIKQPEPGGPEVGA